MSELRQISGALEDTIKDSELHALTSDFSEAMLDSIMSDGLAKDIPIIGSIVGTGKVFLGLRERLFLKKIICFLSELKKISPKKRKEMVEKIDTSKKFKIKVGEKLIYIIEKCDDHEKSNVIAKLFSAFINETITYSEFLKSARIVDHTSTEDLADFVNSNWTRITIEEAGNFTFTGLANIESPSISVEDQNDRKESGKYIVHGDELNVYVTDLGLKIRQVLKPL